ncbi:protein C19orf12 homolog [Thomomys bottae]
MTLTVQDVIQLLCYLSKEKEMQAAVKPSWKGNLVIGTGAFVGGLVGGPAGFLVGGIIGSLLTWKTKEEFMPVPKILIDLPRSEKKKLFTQVSGIVRNLDWMDAAQLSALVLHNETLQERMLTLVVNYVTKDLQAKIRYGN